MVDSFVWKSPALFFLLENVSLSSRSMSESHQLTDDSDRYAAEVFDAQRAEILAFFLVGICEDPADRVRFCGLYRTVSMCHALYDVYELNARNFSLQSGSVDRVRSCYFIVQSVCATLCMTCMS